MLLPGNQSAGEDYRKLAGEGEMMRAFSAALRAAHTFEQQGDFRSAGVWHREIYYSIYLHNQPGSGSRPQIDPVNGGDPAKRGISLISVAKRAILALRFYDAIKALAEAEPVVFSNPDGGLTLARFYACRALCHDRLGDIGRAVVDYEQAAALMIDSGNHSRAASYLNSIGFCLSENQQWERGEQYLLRGLEIIQKARRRHLEIEGALQDSLGYTHIMMKSFDKAQVFLERATRVFQSSPDLLSRVGSNLRLYAFHRVRRDYTAARAVAERSLALAAELGSEPLLSEIKHRLSYFDLPEVAKGSRLKCFRGILYSTGDVERIVSSVKTAAPIEEPVLILGETGTGKELVAQAIHRESNQSKGPFVPFNCSTAIKGLAESQLFGHVKGAFTDARSDQDGVIQAAENGSLFLDEIGDLDPATQASLLRFLQNGEVQPVGAKRPVKVPVRVITATNRDLEKDALSGRFRLDLFHRLSVVTLRLPPLRNRVADILPLAIYFIEIYSEQYRKPRPVLTDDEKLLLDRHVWPGNIRELENYAKRRALFGDQAIEWLREQVRGSRSGSDIAAGPASDWRKLTGAEKKALIDNALGRFSGNITHAARSLGISRRTIQILLKRLA